MSKLDIIIPHGGEPWEICRKFFDMLRLQLVADWSQVKVLVIHDNCADWPATRLQDLPVKVEQHRVFKRRGKPGNGERWDPKKCERAGVSAARNLGLEISQAEWVMFCDCDDMFANVWAMHGILDALNQPDACKNDLLWTKFYMEQSAGRDVQGMNWIFIHGKIYRRQFLEDEGIRFAPQLYYAEDSAFNAIVDAAIDHGRIGEIQMDAVPYVWVWNRQSVTSRPENNARNTIGLFDRHEWVAAEYEKRGAKKDAAALRARAVWDAFYQWHRTDVVLKDLEIIRQRAGAFAAKYADVMDRVTDEAMDLIRKAARDEAKKKRLQAEPEPEWRFPEWLEEIKELYGGGQGVQR